MPPPVYMLIFIRDEFYTRKRGRGDLMEECYEQYIHYFVIPLKKNQARNKNQ